MRIVQLVAIAATLLVGLSTTGARAHSPYQKVFETRYIRRENEEALAAYKAARCNICHVKGQEKKELNRFGAAIHKALPAGDRAALLKSNKMAALKDLEDALSKVEMQNRPDGGTWKELILSGKLP